MDKEQAQAASAALLAPLRDEQDQACQAIADRGANAQLYLLRHRQRRLWLAAGVGVGAVACLLLRVPLWQAVLVGGSLGMLIGMWLSRRASA